MATAMKERTGKSPTRTFDSSGIVDAYVSLLAEKEKVEERLQELRALAQVKMDLGQDVASDKGAFALVTVNKMSWSIYDLQEAFGEKHWTKFASADNWLCKKFVDAQEKSGKPSAEAVALKSRAVVDTSTQLRFNRL